MSLDTPLAASASATVLSRDAAALGGRTTAETRARAKATEFEQVFLTSMFNQMFAGLDTSGPFGGGMAEETWRGILVDQYAGQIAKAGGIGIADAVYSQLLQVQEGASR